MITTTLKIEGMMCGMCEAHINQAVRSHFKIKKIKTSHKKGTCEIQSEEPLDEALLIRTIEETGYRVMKM
ncbi:MAG: heavy-metal-associated domain-containing protein [Blautia sp.]|nr:heavy-metal-associated domain-containing protein [Blautia sp.]